MNPRAYAHLDALTMTAALQDALHSADPVAAMVLLPLIADAVALARSIEALRLATGETK